ncbi:ribosome maturation factor RimP [Leuconostocaceae bacterium ESL0958]|nr:ribosome maturation factor RimP [Leuconostocaceae bacterium ESL0958]
MSGSAVVDRLIFYDSEEGRQMVATGSQDFQALLAPILQEAGLLLWSFQIKKVGGQKTVEVLVDRADHQGISMQEITDLTQAVNEQLDQAGQDPIEGEYLLDIASPGLDRTLSDYWQFEWAQAEDAAITVALFAPQHGAKKWTGRIAQLNEQGLTLDCQEQQLTLSFDEIAKAVMAVQL